MALQSMTGFARVEGSNSAAKWVWEARSVNGKGLDFRLRSPPGYDAIQPQIRKILTNNLSRGNLQISLNLEFDDSEQVPVVNEAALEAVLNAIDVIQKRIDCKTPAPEQILAIKGVLAQGGNELDKETSEVLTQQLMVDFGVLVSQLVQAREKEGRAVADHLVKQIDQIEVLTKAIIGDPSRSIDQIKSRLHESISRLVENAAGLDLDRVHQEAAILATKADLAEELDRLSTHIDAAREMLGCDGPVGRRLDFLCQEFNRECNTICSKSNAASVTASGLDMKVVIDQVREQVQNLE